jgi:hypothetical protein
MLYCIGGWRLWTYFCIPPPQSPFGRRIWSWKYPALSFKTTLKDLLVMEFICNVGTKEIGLLWLHLINNNHEDPRLCLRDTNTLVQSESLLYIRHPKNAYTFFKCIRNSEEDSIWCAAWLTASCLDWPLLISRWPTAGEFGHIYWPVSQMMVGMLGRWNMVGHAVACFPGCQAVLFMYGHWFFAAFWERERERESEWVSECVNGACLWPVWSKATLGYIWPVGVQVVQAGLSVIISCYKCWRCHTCGQ